jgi:purine-cytosine permease-like protein
MSPSNDIGDDVTPPPAVRLGSRRITLPRSRALRIALGCLLILGGLLGFLPVLGFWMVPLGVLVLAADFPVARRLSRRVGVWWGRRWRAWTGRG